MNSLTKIVFKNFCSTWEYKAILLYIAISMFFITPQYSGFGYLEIFNYSFTNKIFLVVVLYPSFLVMFYIIFNNLKCNTEIILRFNSRREFCKKLIFTILFMTMFLYFQTILITLICCNITQNSGFKITENLGFNTLDIYVYIINLLKILLTTFIITLIGVLTIFKSNSRSKTLIILILFLIIICFGDKFYPSGIYLLDLFNPGFNSHGYMLTNKLSVLIISGIAYFNLVIFVLLLFIFKNCKNVELGVK